ncbi:MAG: type II secretion system protein [Candidatus Gracilibacteria bacterium]|nr:type II secretion system protein [Candidatus Gracilibacteria bacterium]
MDTKNTPHHSPEKGTPENCIREHSRGCQKQIGGFTLVELIVVITILAILGTIAFISFQGYGDDAKDATKITDLSQINTALNIAIAGEKGFALSGLKPITYKGYPQDITTYLGELSGSNIPGLNNPPLDPFTQKPYILGIYTGGNGGLVKYAQVGAVLENKKGDAPLALVEKTYAADQYAPALVPMQRITGNYNPGDIYGISGLIPRWALEDYEGFKKTDFYASGSKMYGGSWGFNNNYIFAMNGVPLVQVAGYTDTGTLLYESFENIKIEVLTAPGNKANNYKKYPSCSSKSSSTSLSYEGNTTYTDQIQTTDCGTDTSSGVNAQSSLHIKWLRDSTAGDGQYNYMILDPAKKYQYSWDVKGHLSNTVDGGKLRVAFSCAQKTSTGSTTTIATKYFFVTLDPNNFTRISAYVNSPDPSGNSLSISIPGGITDSTSCILFRSNIPKAGDELWFDNHIIKEIP